MQVALVPVSKLNACMDSRWAIDETVLQSKNEPEEVT